ncbi:hypothetical protein K438DRAFT_2126985 [Mycena galopus ATCC 62051]|nr:hypothetical protein K438DRAFT_2126985 [Mycena galopus ATCC 62051]
MTTPPHWDWGVPGVFLPPSEAPNIDISTPRPWLDLKFDPASACDLRRHLGATTDEPGRFMASLSKFLAADLGFLASDASTDGRHAVGFNDFFREFWDLCNTTRQESEDETLMNSLGASDRKIFAENVRKVLFDLATILDRAIGSTTMVLSAEGTVAPGTPPRPEYLKAHLNILPFFLAENDASKPHIATIIQMFCTCVGASCSCSEVDAIATSPGNVVVILSTHHAATPFLAQMSFTSERVNLRNISVAREQKNRFAKDIALAQFLRLMCYFRTVLVQDFAILFTKYPTCPVFKLPPFNSPTFRHFAAQSSARIVAAEDKAKLALANLPRSVAETFRGAVTNFSLEQKREQDASRAYMEGLHQKISLVSDLMQHNMSGTTSRKRGSLAIYLASTNSAVAPTPTVSPLKGNFMTAVFAEQSFFTSSSNFGHAQTPIQFLEPPAAILASSTNANTDAVATQLDAWNKLAARFGGERLRRHQWEWITIGKDANSYMEFYTFQHVSKITDIWTEWASGLNGFLAIRDMEETWVARWRRDNSGLKTEMRRRKKMIRWLTKLLRQTNLALQN